MSIWNKVEPEDRAMFVGSILVPLVVWWIYTGRKKYGIRGANKIS